MLKRPSRTTKMTGLAAVLPVAVVAHVDEPSMKTTVPCASEPSGTLAGQPEYQVADILACRRRLSSCDASSTGVPPGGLAGMVSGATWPGLYCLQVVPVCPVQRSETSPGWAELGPRVLMMTFLP